jgi:transcriptional regulator with XRE-family HTH domain
MGVSHSHYSAIENGRQNLTFGTFDRLYKALGARPAALFDEGRPPKPKRASPTPRATKKY